MNRNNLWIHIGLATVLIVFAAVLGQIDRWKTALNGPQTRIPAQTGRTVKPVVTETAGAPEVLVRFKPGVTLDRVREVVAANNDRLSDEIEAVNGLTVIDDVDNADAATVAAQYSAMSDLVAYAEPNFEIRLDPLAASDSARDLLYRKTDSTPNDPMFAEQWALNNLGQDGGKNAPTWTR